MELWHTWFPVTYSTTYTSEAHIVCPVTLHILPTNAVDLKKKQNKKANKKKKTALNFSFLPPTGSCPSASSTELKINQDKPAHLASALYKALDGSRGSSWIGERPCTLDHGGKCSSFPWYLNWRRKGHEGGRQQSAKPHSISSVCSASLWLVHQFSLLSILDYSFLSTLVWGSEFICIFFIRHKINFLSVNSNFPHWISLLHSGLLLFKREPILRYFCSPLNKAKIF